MVEFRIGVLGDDVLAFRLSEFDVLAYFMDDDAALFALKHVREPAVGQFVTKVAEVERFHF
jgi:hypothetical protein